MLSSLPSNTKSPVTHAAYRSDLKKKILISQKQIRDTIELNNAKIIHRTDARNCKSPHVTIIADRFKTRFLNMEVSIMRKLDKTHSGAIAEL